MNRREMMKRSALVGAAATLAPSLFAQSSSAPLQLRLPELPFAMDALAPAIDAETMALHYGKHHAGYTRKLNAALEAANLSAPLEQLLASLKLIPEAQRDSLQNNGGGYWNHTLFWNSMQAPQLNRGPQGELAFRLKRDFGSFAAFQDAFSQAAATQFGSGWAWLVERNGRLAVCSTENQDNPLMKDLLPVDQLGTPLLGLDVWEHAYYLHYQNRRSDYIHNWWKLVNWDAVSARLG